MSVKIYEQIPDGFNPIVQVSACYLEIDGHLLLLECGASQKEAGRWGIPAGKIEPNETPHEAAQRELLEETGIQITSSNLHSIGYIYIRKPETDYIFHQFKVFLEKRPEVRLSSEHSSYLWVQDQDLEMLPLMAGAKEALAKYRAV